MAHIENEVQYKAAMERIEELLLIVTDETPLYDKNAVELVLLSDLVADYDEEHFPIKAPSLPEMLKLRMYELKLTQKGLAQLLLISPARINEILSGKKEPTLKVARQISLKLSIDPSIILGVAN
ncbi:MAG: helix-turn-helix domain-containing protein [Anaerovoracaceae bacterium]